MRVFAILFAGLLIFVIASTSLSYAAPPRDEYEVPSFLTWLYRNFLAYTGMVPVNFELQPSAGDNEGAKVGGDADDYANGRDDGGIDTDSTRKEKLKSDGRKPLGPQDGSTKNIKPSGLR